MAKKEATIPASLSTMLGSGDTIEIQGKTYTVKPMKLKDVDVFVNDNITLGSQFFSLMNDDNKKKIAKWIENYCFDDKGKPVTLEMAMDDDWDITDLKRFVEKLCDLSG